MPILQPVAVRLEETRGLMPGLFAKCMLFLAPRKDYLSGLKHTIPRPFETMYTSDNFGYNSVNTIQQVNVRVAQDVSERETTSIITIINEPRVCWNWWPSLRRLHKYCILADSKSNRARLRRVLAMFAENYKDEVFTQLSVATMSAVNLNRRIIRMVKTYNNDLRAQRLGAGNELVDVVVILSGSEVSVPVPIVTPALPSCDAEGAFHKESESSEWGTFVDDSGVRHRVLKQMITQTDNIARITARSPHACWVNKMWSNATAEIQRRSNFVVSHDELRNQNVLAPQIHQAQSAPRRSIRVARYFKKRR